MKYGLLSLLGGVAMATAAYAAETPHDHQAHGHMMGAHASAADTRRTLDVPDAMKEHQKQNMREHLRAVQQVTALMAHEEWDQAAGVAHAQLGLTDEMRRMCSMFGPEFMAMGLEFHESGDRLGEALKTKDRHKAQAALAETLEKCVVCHDTFKH